MAYGSSETLSTPVDVDAEKALEKRPNDDKPASRRSSRSDPPSEKLSKQFPLHSSDKRDPEFLVSTLDEDEDPKNLSRLRKVIIILVVSSGALCSTCASSMASFAEAGEVQEFGVSKEVTVLGVSLYVAGIGIGPLLVGPLSEVYGRSIIYRVSYSMFWIFSWPVAFAPNMAVFLVFRFVTGFFSSAFLSVAGGSVSDIFTPRKTAIPVALYTLAPFIGPMLGPLISGFINQNTSWRWTYRVLLIWVFCECVAIFLLVPETYEPTLLQRKARRLREQRKDSRWYAPLDVRSGSLSRAIIVSCYRPFELLMIDRMNLLLDIWTAVLLGILYLAFQAFPIIFVDNHGFDASSTGLSFIGIGVGMTAGCIINVCLINHLQNAHPEGLPPPEARLLPGKVGAIIVPLSLFWLAFTTYSHVHWIAPIIASAFFGAGFLLCFSSTFAYLVAGYRPMAASAMAANAFVRSSVSAAFPLFAAQMYVSLGTVGATALLAAITAVCAPLPYVFAKIGARLRAVSPFATHDQ